LSIVEGSCRARGDVVSQSGDHLESGQLGTADVTASTVANIGPGIDFYFGFGVIAVTAGVAAPLTILAAAVAVALLAFTVAEFTTAEPSAGSFITYVETALGARAGVATALLVTVGYTVAIAAVFTMSGGLVALTFSQFTSWHPWWGPFTVVLTAGATWLTARGVKLSTIAVGAAVLVQVAIIANGHDVRAEGDIALLRLGRSSLQLGRNARRGWGVYMALAC
jgi:amino acid transporter